MNEQRPSKDVTTCKHEAEFRMLDTLPCPWCVIDELKRGREELQCCLNHYQARFSLITNAWRSGDNSAVLDAVRKHITAKDCEDADRIARASHEPPPEHEWPLITRIKADIVANCFENREWSAESEDHCATLDLLSEALEVIKERAAQPPAPDVQMAMALISEVDCHLANAKWDKDATARRKLHQAHALLAPTKEPAR